MQLLNSIIHQQNEDCKGILAYLCFCLERAAFCLTANYCGGLEGSHLVTPSRRRFIQRFLRGCLTGHSGERLNSSQSLSGSIPLISTKTANRKAKSLAVLLYRGSDTSQKLIGGSDSPFPTYMMDSNDRRKYLRAGSVDFSAVC